MVSTYPWSVPVALRSHWRSCSVDTTFTLSELQVLTLLSDVIRLAVKNSWPCSAHHNRACIFRPFVSDLDISWNLFLYSAVKHIAHDPLDCIKLTRKTWKMFRPDIRPALGHGPFCPNLCVRCWLALAIAYYCARLGFTLHCNGCFHVKVPLSGFPYHPSSFHFLFQELLEKYRAGQRMVAYSTAWCAEMAGTQCMGR